MSDIIEQLGNNCYCSELGGGECAPCKARKEIERLRKENDKLRKELDDCQYVHNISTLGT